MFYGLTTIACSLAGRKANFITTLLFLFCLHSSDSLWSCRYWRFRLDEIIFIRFIYFALNLLFYIYVPFNFFDNFHIVMGEIMAENASYRLRPLYYPCIDKHLNSKRIHISSFLMLFLWFFCVVKIAFLVKGKRFYCVRITCQKIYI